MKHTVVFSFLTGLLLVIFNSVIMAQPTQQLPDKTLNPIDPTTVVGAPKITVTEVKFAGITTGTQPKQLIRTKWTAQIPSTTKVENFSVILRATFQDGSTFTSTLNASDTAREVTFQAPIKGVANPLKTFQAVVESVFTTILVQKIDFNSAVNLSKSNGLVATNTGANQRGEGITQISVVPGTQLKNYEIKWSLGAPARPGIREQNFKVTASFKFNEVNVTRTATTTVGPGVRQTILTISDPPKLNNGPIIDVTAKVEFFFKILQRNEAVLNGNF